MDAPKNVEELRDALGQLFSMSTDNPTKETLASITVSTNVAGKMLGTVKTQLMYHAAREEEPDIAFLDV